MKDKELLELAAKAAGWTWRKSKHGYWNLTSPNGEQHTACNGWDRFDRFTGNKIAEPEPADALLEVGFCPPIDDGDCARLEAVLETEIQWHEDGVQAGKRGNPISVFCFYADYGGDKNNTRRVASVTFAAEIGKGMQ